MSISSYGTFKPGVSLLDTVYMTDFFSWTPHLETLFFFLSSTSEVEPLKDFLNSKEMGLLWVANGTSYMFSSNISYTLDILTQEVRDNRGEINGGGS